MPQINTMKAAYILGFAGLLPFMGLAVTAWSVDVYHVSLPMDATVSYGALILSFLGALYWGRALRDNKVQTNGKWVIWSVIPFLVAWGLTFLPPFIGLVALMGMLVICIVMDYIAHRAHFLPSWMMRLRLMLTSGALCAVFAVWLAAATSSSVPFHQHHYLSTPGIAL